MTQNKKHSIDTLKRMARAALNGKWPAAVKFSAFTLLITFLLVLINQLFTPGDNIVVNLVLCIINIITSLLLSLVYAGGYYFYLNISRGRAYALSDLFAAFRFGPDRFLTTAFLRSLPAFVLSLPTYLIPEFSYRYVALALLLTYLSLILQIILTLNFILADFLLLDFQDMEALEAMRISAHLMKGNKGRYFVMVLSFLGWTFLGILTLGIGMLWVEPYRIMTITYFYEELLFLAQPKKEQHGEPTDAEYAYAANNAQAQSWQDAGAQDNNPAQSWQDAGIQDNNQTQSWQDAGAQDNNQAQGWQDAGVQDNNPAQGWQDADAKDDVSNIPVQVTPEKVMQDIGVQTLPEDHLQDTNVPSVQPQKNLEKDIFDQWNTPLSDDLFDED